MRDVQVAGRVEANAVGLILEMLARSVVPGTPGLSNVEHPFLAGKLRAENRPAAVRTVLVNSFGFDGHCWACAPPAASAAANARMNLFMLLS